MRKILLLGIAITMLASCSAYSSLTDNVYLGMNITEFMQKVNRPSLEQASNGVMIYKASKRVVRRGYPIHETHFFYFTNGKLTQIDQGVKSVDHRQRIDVNVNQD